LFSFSAQVADRRTNLLMRAEKGRFPSHFFVLSSSFSEFFVLQVCIFSMEGVHFEISIDPGLFPRLDAELYSQPSFFSFSTEIPSFHPSLGLSSYSSVFPLFFWGLFPSPLRSFLYPSESYRESYQWILPFHSKVEATRMTRPPPL